MERFHGILGLVVILAIAFALSTDRRRVKLRIIAWGLGLQFAFGLFLMKTQAGKAIFDRARIIMNEVMDMTAVGAHFVFGSLAPAPGTPSGDGGPGFILAFQSLPVIIVFSSLMAILYHLGIMQWVVRFFAVLMQKTMKTSGAETLSAAGNIFVGMTEAPLLVRPFVEEMTLSELMAVMTGGLATIAGSVFALYVSFGINAGHLLTASVMSAPAALMIAKIMVPETETPRTLGALRLAMERDTQNVIDAAASGAAVGLRLALNVAAMLLAFIALLHLVNLGLGGLGDLLENVTGTDLFPGEEKLSLAKVFGWLFGWLAWCMGVPAGEMSQAGNLLGVKVSLNELIAFKEMASSMEAGHLGPKATVILTYALCGFANFGSIAIILGGLGGLAPSRRKDLARLGLRAMVGGALASFTTGALAGILY